MSQIQILRNYNKKKEIVTVPLTGLRHTLQRQRNCASVDGKKDNTSSPLVENGFSPLVEQNRGMNDDNNNNLLLLLPTRTTNGSERDEDGFRQYLLAQKKGI
jgi:hypothetical protein